MKRRGRGRTPGTPHQVATADDTPNGSSEAATEATIRLRAAGQLATEMAAGRWPRTVETIDMLGALLAHAARWQLLAELDQFGLAA